MKILVNFYVNTYQLNSHVGQKRLDKAIAAFHKNGENHRPCSISVTWKPYQIDPGTAVNGEEFEAYNQRRWGGSGWTRSLKQNGMKDGASFKDWNWWPNTMKAHQMVKFADERCGVDTAKSNAALFNALYEEGKNVSLLDVLVQVGKDDLGLPEDELRRYLEEDEGAEAVRFEIEEGRKMYRITGVPFFVISRVGSEGPPYGLSGAQSARSFLDVFEKLTKE